MIEYPVEVQTYLAEGPIERCSNCIILELERIIAQESRVESLAPADFSLVEDLGST